MTNEEALARVWQMLIDAADRENGMLHEIHNDPLRHYPHLIYCFAWQSAVKIIKRQIQARGERLHEYSALDLRILADAYLEANRARLIEETIETVRTTPAFLSLAEKEARRRGRMWPLEAKPMRRPRVLPLDVINDPKLFPQP